MLWKTYIARYQTYRSLTKAAQNNNLRKNKAKNKIMEAFKQQFFVFTSVASSKS